MRRKLFTPAAKSSVVGSMKTFKVLSPLMRTNWVEEEKPLRGSLISWEETGFDRIHPISFSTCYLSWCGVVVMAMMTKTLRIPN